MIRRLPFLLLLPLLCALATCRPSIRDATPFDYVIGVSMANLNYQTFGTYVSQGVAKVIATPAPLGPLVAALTSLVGSSIEAKKAASFCCGAACRSR